MTTDTRTKAAKYYDLNPNFPSDIQFYQAILSSELTTILELGCGTGRILIPLSRKCLYIHGMDRSDAMLTICRRKMKEAAIPHIKAYVELGDITSFNLDREFNFIIAPFRVLQNLESDAEVEGLFRCLKGHLAADGSCILNVFNPDKEPESLQREWQSINEDFVWEIPYLAGRLKCYLRKSRINLEPLTLYPEMLYRYYEDEMLKEEVALKMAMRCYYPDEFEDLIKKHGFRIINKWGGYTGETYGEGPELIIQFTNY